jgi:hypothetical protein
VLSGLLLLSPISESVRFLFSRLLRPKSLHYIILAVLVVFGGLMVVIRAQHRDADGEPFVWFEGISVWPSVLGFYVALCLSVYLANQARTRFKWSKIEIEHQFGLRAESRESDEPKGGAGGQGEPDSWGWLGKAWAGIRPQVLSPVDLRQEQAGSGESEKPENASGTEPPTTPSWFKRCTAWYRSVNIVGWNSPSCEADETDRVSVKDIWQEYMWRGEGLHRALRVAACTLAYFALAYSLFEMFDRPIAPTRSDLCASVEQFIQRFTVFSMLFLVFLSLDATRLCQRFIRNLYDEFECELDYEQVGRPGHPSGGAVIRKRCGRRADWSAVKAGPAADGRGMEEEDVREWLNIRLIAMRTSVVGKLIYYPFIVMLIMIVARHGFTDNWRWNLPLLLVISLSFLAATASAFFLRGAAEKARRTSVERLRDQLTKVWSKGASETNRAQRERRARQLEITIADVENMKEGAFSPPWQNPVLRALLIPLGGAGSLALIDQLPRLMGAG